MFVYTICYWIRRIAIATLVVDATAGFSVFTGFQLIDSFNYLFWLCRFYTCKTLEKRRWMFYSIYTINTLNNVYLWTDDLNVVSVLYVYIFFLEKFGINLFGFIIIPNIFLRLSCFFCQKKISIVNILISVSFKIRLLIDN